MDLGAGAEIGALGEEHKVLQLEHPLNNLRRLALHLNPTLIVRHHHRLAVHKVTHTAKDQVRIGARNLQLLRQCVKVATNLLKVRRGHMDDRRKRHVRKLDLLDVGVKELHHPGVRRTLLRVLRTNAKLVRIGRREEERQTVIVRQCLNQLEEVDHIDTKHVLGRTVEVLETVRIQTQIRQHSMRVVHVHHLHTRRIKLEIGLRQDLLQRLDQRTKRRRLDRTNLEQVPIMVRGSCGGGGCGGCGGGCCCVAHPLLRSCALGNTML